MDNSIKLTQQHEDADIFKDIQNTIEKELSNMKKIEDDISELRVEAANLESSLLMTIDATTWLEISELTGLGTMSLNVGLNNESENTAEEKLN